MKSLDKDWITSDLIDFEYKQYIFLAYLKDVKENFTDKKLYPYLSDLVFHYQNLVSIKQNKTLILENFPKRISKADFEKLKITYKKIVEDDAIMQELEDILEFSIPQCKKLLDEGVDIHKEVEEQMEIEPVGVTPLYADEGYFFLSQATDKETDVYRYQISIFENANETFRGIHTSLIGKEIRSISRTFEQLKIDLVKNHPDLPNPATYVVYSRSKFPYIFTLLPIAKRMLIKYISTTHS